MELPVKTVIENKFKLTVLHSTGNENCLIAGLLALAGLHRIFQPPAGIQIQRFAEGRRIDKAAVNPGIIAHSQKQCGFAGGYKRDYAALCPVMVGVHIRITHLQLQFIINIKPVGGIDLGKFDGIRMLFFWQIQCHGVADAAVGTAARVSHGEIGVLSDGDISVIVALQCQRFRRQQAA